MVRINVDRVPALVLILVIAIGCAAPSDRRSVQTPAGGTQDRYCHGLGPEECDLAADRALTFVPDMAESPKAIIATVGPVANGDFIVAFAPFGDSEVWSPPILRVDRGASPNWAADYWKGGPVPDSFAQQMTAAGLDAP